jgi:hypothetical protein
MTRALFAGERLVADVGIPATTAAVYGYAFAAGFVTRGG